jgi:plasmid stabilization system protein ParE
MKVIISQRAEEDVALLYARLALERGEPAAEQFRARVEKALDLLQRHPEAGPQPGWATGHEDLRFWVISRTPCVIYYEYQSGEIAIERVLDGRRDVRRLMEARIEEPPPEE